MQAILGSEFHPVIEVMAATKQGRKNTLTLSPLASSILAIVISIIGVWVMLFAWLEPHLEGDLKKDVTIEVQAQLKDPIKQIGDMAGDVREIKGKLEVLDPLIRQLLPQRVGAIAKDIGTLSPQGLKLLLPQLRDLVAAAKASQIQVKTSDVTEIGKKVIDASQANKEAWDTALLLVDYRSFLNKYSPDVPISGGSSRIDTVYLTLTPPGYEAPAMSVIGIVPRDQAARLIYKGKSQDMSSDPTKGNEFLYLDGGGLEIDDTEMKNVILTNVHVVYKGGALTMTNVYFVNCTFEMPFQPNGIRLADSILQPSPATYFKSESA